MIKIKRINMGKFSLKYLPTLISCVMFGIKNNQIVIVPFEDALRQVHELSIPLYELARSLSI